jgi:hypothetical protein
MGLVCWLGLEDERKWGEKWWLVRQRNRVSFDGGCLFL